MLHNNTTYTPFGMLMPGRHASSENYRYGFQNQEVDNEIKGIGNSVNYKYRMHDPRLGRFFAVDPLSAQYPHNSPYAFSENKVIAWVELEGLEATGSESGSTELSKKEKDTFNNSEFIITDEGTTIIDDGKASVDKYVRPPEKTSEEILNMTFGEYFEWKYQNHGPGFVDADGTLLTRNSKMELMLTWGLSYQMGLLAFNYGTYRSLQGSWMAQYGSVKGGTGYFNGSIGSMIPKPKVTIDEYTGTGGNNWLRINGEQEGYYVINYNKTKLNVEIELNISKQYRNQGYGKMLFKEAVDGSDTFTAKWVQNSKIYESGSSVNLYRYNSGIKNKLTPSEAAWTTWSGKQAKANGFTSVKVTPIDNGVQAVFSR